MTKETVLYIMLVLSTRLSTCLDIFHENTHILFTPKENRVIPNIYFGYSTLLTPNGLYVGAPKSIEKSVRTGYVYYCLLNNLSKNNNTCHRLGSDVKDKLYMPINLYKDSWFGANLALLEDKRLLVTAPRLTSHYKYIHFEHVLQGAGYLIGPRMNRILNPLADRGLEDEQGMTLDGVRKEYGVRMDRIYNYALGQFGFSMATNNNTVIFGAPGLTGWTGGIISYTYNPRIGSTDLKPIVNTYKTKDLHPDDYFGYSVETGFFDKKRDIFFIGGAPRSEGGHGKVLVYKPSTSYWLPLDIKAKLIGPQVGSYFGATLCSTDINEDGLDDLLVGAPMFVSGKGSVSYDEGAVFIYITRQNASGFVLEESGYVVGLSKTAARFGTAIADLGDINGDGLRDIAIGAPYEDNGIGAVYIYKGQTKGLDDKYMQRIQPPEARGFGWSIAKGIDVDNNYCNDLAIGAYMSDSSYLYRCIPTMSVRAVIKMPNNINLRHSAPVFKAQFCVHAPPTKFQSNLALNLTARIVADSKYNRAKVLENSSYTVTAIPGKEKCDTKTIHVNVSSNLLEPMIFKFDLEANELMEDLSTTFIGETVRISDDSELESSLTAKIMKDCGDDLICNPWLNMKLETLDDNPYIPGSNQSLGLRFIAQNIAEPAYALKVQLILPLHPIRIPSDCSLLNLTLLCNLPSPFEMNQTVKWEIELEYNLKVIKNVDLIATAELIDKYYTKIADEYVKELVIGIEPVAEFKISGKSTPNATMMILRDSLTTGENILFKHNFEITNLGPSDWHALDVHIQIPDKTNLSADIRGCKPLKYGVFLNCVWSVPAKTSFVVSLPLQLDLSVQGDFLKQNMTYNATSFLYTLGSRNQFRSHSFITYEVTTTLILEPASIIWYFIVAGVFIGLMVLVIFVWILYECGFFNRLKYEKIQNIPLKDISESDRTSQSEDENPEEIEKL